MLRRMSKTRSNAPLSLTTTKSFITLVEKAFQSMKYYCWLPFNAHFWSSLTICIEKMFQWAKNSISVVTRHSIKLRKKEKKASWPIRVKQKGETSRLVQFGFDEQSRALRKTMSNALLWKFMQSVVNCTRMLKVAILVTETREVIAKAYR